MRILSTAILLSQLNWLINNNNIIPMWFWKTKSFKTKCLEVQASFWTEQPRTSKCKALGDVRFAQFLFQWSMDIYTDHLKRLFIIARTVRKIGLGWNVLYRKQYMCNINILLVFLSHYRNCVTVFISNSLQRYLTESKNIDNEITLQWISGLF